MPSDDTVVTLLHSLHAKLGGPVVDGRPQSKHRRVWALRRSLDIILFHNARWVEGCDGDVSCSDSGNDTARQSAILVASIAYDLSASGRQPQAERLQQVVAQLRTRGRGHYVRFLLALSPHRTAAKFEHTSRDCVAVSVVAAPPPRLLSSTGLLSEAEMQRMLLLAVVGVPVATHPVPLSVRTLLRRLSVTGAQFQYLEAVVQHLLTRMPSDDRDAHDDILQAFVAEVQALLATTLLWVNDASKRHASANGKQDSTIISMTVLLDPVQRFIESLAGFVQSAGSRPGSTAASGFDADDTATTFPRSVTLLSLLYTRTVELVAAGASLTSQVRLVLLVLTTVSVTPHSHCAGVLSAFPCCIDALLAEDQLVGVRRHR